MRIVLYILLSAILLASLAETSHYDEAREESAITCVAAATSNETVLDRLDRCVRSMASQFIDHLVDGDSVSLMDGVKLVRVKKSNAIAKIEYGRDWSSRFFYKVAQLLETHVIRIRLSGWLGGDESGRGIKNRHHMKHMFPMMVMGYMFMSSFLVPMGFQLMAVLSGKALLLSKMAFVMSGMHGFKRLFGVDYPAVIHHDTIPLYHDHHASSTWRRIEDVEQLASS